MKKINLIAKQAVLLAAVCSLAAFTGCSKASNASKSSGISGNVSLNGSTSMESVVGILSEKFMQDYSSVKITYDATGSGTGIEAASNGTCDIGLASRDLKSAEKEKGLVQTTVAYDGIAIIVNASSPISDLSVDDVALIYTGKVANWSELGGENLAIACIGREAGSGTRDGFESITKTGGKCVLAQELTSTGAVIEAVKNSPNAIGYASFSAVEGKTGIKVLKIGGVMPDETTIADGSYKVQRNFNFITKDGAELSAAAKAFFDWATSKEASDLISQAGVVPAAN